MLTQDANPADGRARLLTAGDCSGLIRPLASANRQERSDTVPLCRGHHRQLHQAGNEVAWWEGLHINALEIAKGLWERTRPKSVAADVHPNEDAAKALTEN